MQPADDVRSGSGTVIVREELFVVIVETLVKPTDLGVSTSVVLPEALDSLLVHHVYGSLPNLSAAAAIAAQRGCHVIRLPASNGTSSDAARVSSRRYGEASVNPTSVNDAARQYVTRNSASARCTPRGWK